MSVGAQAKNVLIEEQEEEEEDQSEWKEKEGEEGRRKAWC